MSPTAWAGNKIDELEVLEILPDTLDKMITFPGYDRVHVSFPELRNYLYKSTEWQSYLKARKGVYVISDAHTGKLYVGSAYGENGIYGRWKTYVDYGIDENEKENDGERQYPNKKLQELVKNEGLEYIHNNFHYALLETFTDDVDNTYIIQRESFWKEILLTRGDFGYNVN